MRGIPLLVECSPLDAHRINGSLCGPTTGRLSPSLFVIGSLKTGTTSLWAHLVDNSHDWITPGALTHKGDISRKEKDFFGDPTQWRLGHHWYERIWPRCPVGKVVAIDATPAYHVRQSTRFCPLPCTSRPRLSKSQVRKPPSGTSAR